MSSSEAAMIAAASAFAGGVIVAASNFAVTWLQQRAAARAELRRALIDLWAVIGRIDHRLSTDPKPGRIVLAVNRQFARLPVIDHSLDLTRRRLLEPDRAGFVIEMHRAMAAASLLAPLSLLPALSSLTDVMAEAADGGEAWHERWRGARRGFFLACRNHLGSGIVDSPSP
jgi:hypothetical protein